MGNLEDLPSAVMLYHGTDNTFDEYKRNSFFSASKSFSELYGKIIREENVVLGKTFDSLDKKCIQELMDTVGNLIDPYDGEEYGDPATFINALSSDTWEAIEEHLPNIESMGYESVMIFEGGAVNYVVFNPENILENKLTIVEDSSSDMGM